MIKLTLKDGSVREIESAQPAAEIIKGIGMGLYKAACCVKLNGEVKDLRTVVDSDCEFEVCTFDSLDGKKTFWHTASHILAQAVKRLYPEAKLAIGPAIDNGFYYDFDLEKPFTPEELEKIEAEMKKIVKENLPLEQFELSPEEAVAKLKEMDEPHKVELCEEHAGKGEPISFYKQGEFVDLCAGPHLMTTAPVKAFKLLSCTGAYWRGSEKNKMLSRVYATKGARVIQLLQRWVEDVEQKHGYLLTKTPYVAKRELYKISGHWDHYLDGMFVLGDPNDEEKECFALRPMTCPFQYQVFLNRQRSYRDLPMRLGETSTLFRNEDSGEMHGLIRVRQFTISEGHLILRPEQLEEEFKDCLELAKEMLGTVGLLDDCTFRFSQWDPANPKNKYEGTKEQWDYAQEVMGKILDHLGLEYTVGIDEAAFYGPKLDIQYKNVYGKEDTLVTIQIDMLLAKRFGMEYVDVDGTKKTPYIIHRTSLGCYERTLAYMIEKYAGAMPLWLAPEQVRIVPVADRHIEYCDKLLSALESVGIRASIDDRAEKVGKKVRDARLEKLPVWVTVGDKEVENGTVSVSSRREGDLGSMTQAELVTKLLEDVAKKVR